MILTFFIGMLISFLGSMAPTGPIAVIVIKRGLNREKRSVVFLAAGAAVAEAGYALLAYLGISFALSRHPIGDFVIRLLLAMILAGFAFLCMGDRRPLEPKNGTHRRGSAHFLLGLSIAALNPTFLVTWAGAMAVLRGTGLELDTSSAPAFALGVVAGPVLWFWLLLTMLTRHIEYLRPESVQRIERTLPFVLLGLSGILLVQALIKLIF